MIVAGFGWGKPVQVNPRYFNRKISMTKAEAIVAFAGPLMNIILAIISTIIMACLIKFNALANLPIKTAWIILVFIMELILINVGLGLFNLIPLPPLDGHKILNHFLPYKAKEWMARNEQIMYIVFIAIWITGIAGTVISPVIKISARGLGLLFGSVFGVDLSSIFEIFGI